MKSARTMWFVTAAFAGSMAFAFMLVVVTFMTVTLVFMMMTFMVVVFVIVVMIFMVVAFMIMMMDFLPFMGMIMAGMITTASHKENCAADKQYRYYSFSHIQSVY